MRSISLINTHVSRIYCSSLDYSDYSFCFDSKAYKAMSNKYLDVSRVRNDMLDIYYRWDNLNPEFQTLSALSIFKFMRKHGISIKMKSRQVGDIHMFYSVVSSEKITYKSKFYADKSHCLQDGFARAFIVLSHQLKNDG